MTPGWGALPCFKIVVDPAGTPITYTNDAAIELSITRRENDVSSAVLTLNDWRNAAYDSVFDPFTVVDLYLGYSATFTKVLRGWVHTLCPKLSAQGETLEVGIMGNGWGLMKTLCNTNFNTSYIWN